MIANTLVNLAGALLFLFIFWKKLKEDYTSEIVFSSAFAIFIGVIVSSLLSYNFFREWFFWAQLLGGIVGLLVAISRFKMRGYEVFDAGVIASLPWQAIFFLNDSIRDTSFQSFWAFVFILVLMGIYNLIDANYKSFNWYKSGRIGLAGLSTLAILFLTRAAIATQIPSMISLVVKYDPYISGSFAFISFLLIFNLSRKLD